MDSNKIHYRPGPALGHVFIRNLYVMNISLCFPSFIFKCTFDLIFLLKALRKSNKCPCVCWRGWGRGGDAEEIYNHHEYFRSLCHQPTATSHGRSRTECSALSRRWRLPGGDVRWVFGKLHGPLVRNATSRKAEPIAEGLRPYRTVYKNDLPVSALTLTFKITCSVYSSKTCLSEKICWHILL